MSPDPPTAGDRSPASARVALLTNFIAPYRIPLFRMLRDEFGALRVFLSTPMEPNRAWRPDWSDLDVRVLSSVTLRRTARHPHDFSEPLYVHLPVGAPRELWRYRPDVVISGQLGLGSTLSALYCRLRRGASLVLWLTLSEVSELGRGRLRVALRRWLLARADAVMVNGESGARYAESLGTPPDRIFRIYQTVDIEKFRVAAERSADAARRLLIVGSGEPRKGLRPFLEKLGRWVAANAERRVELWIAGATEEAVGAAPLSLPDGLTLRWLGHVAYDDLPGLYAEAGMLAFPTLADEWGLVVNEALAAGLPVLGSRYSQAVEELIEDGATGWTFRPDHPDECADALDRAFATDGDELARMRERCRQRISRLRIEDVVERMLRAVAFARNRRGR
ncbi:MAG: glycosyltransferase family 4 protein [Myxococcota bacterium]